MRTHGLVDAVGDPGTSDHGCVVYRSDDDRDRFWRAAVDFLHDGLALHQRLLVVSDRVEAGLLADLDALGDVVERRRRGQLELVRVVDLDGGGGPVDPRAQVAAHAVRVEDAVADGYDGLRMVADLTPLVVDPAWCGAQVRCEQQTDRYMVDHPFAALCAYDERFVGRETARSLACVHPLRQEGDATFSLYASDEGVTLEGEVDAIQAPLLERALVGLPIEGEVVLDTREMAFVDAAATGVLARFGTRCATSGSAVLVRHAQPVLRRLWELLGFSDIRSVRFQ